MKRENGERETMGSFGSAVLLLAGLMGEIVYAAISLLG